MLKALLKKQFLELNAFYFQDKKTGKRRSGLGTILFIGLFVLLFAGLGYTFYMLCGSFAPLLKTEFPWLYYSLTGLMALLYGTLGSVFNTYTGLYHAKDNDLLLSMPIDPGKILLVRITGVFAMGLLYESMVMIPALITRFQAPGAGAGVVLSGIMLWLLIGVLITALSCLLGYGVAALSGKFKKNKSALTVIFSLAFFAAYYYFFSQAYSVIQSLLMNSEETSHVFKSFIYPMFALGMAGEGHGIYLLGCVVSTAVLMVLVWALLRHSFIHITTKKEDGPKAVYQEETIKARDLEKALFQRELRRFLASPTYMLNAGLGAVLMTAAGIASVVFAPRIRRITEIVPAEYASLLPIIVAAACCLMAGTNVITAPSVSLEGENIWILQCLPVPIGKVFNAKLYLHWALTMIPALMMLAGMAVALQMAVFDAFLCGVLLLGFIQLSSILGLILNLKMPNLKWTNETVAVKQSGAVAIALFGSWLLALVLGAAGFYLRQRVSAMQYLLIVIVLLSLINRLLNRWLKEKGERIFSTLA